MDLSDLEGLDTDHSDLEYDISNNHTDEPVALANKVTNSLSINTYSSSISYDGSASRSITIYAPTQPGDYYLQSNGSGNAPTFTRQLSYNQNYNYYIHLSLPDDKATLADVYLSISSSTSIYAPSWLDGATKIANIKSAMASQNIAAICQGHGWFLGNAYAGYNIMMLIKVVDNEFQVLQCWGTSKWHSWSPTSAEVEEMSGLITDI